ncbi:ABC transporter permease [Dyadobacter subterraneus]|uniref:ABC transporter permease n=1 Tax=Dyadobacter subterraneus TaxID=2773304 RepID=A0ABR9W8Z9_9BACT|nr:ABC transporter permease [Dyadobacter subterraneus]MBE9461938.1 ABC transporter permease [Dyadobacter subterraneus]
MNVTCLTFGIAGALMIALYVADELKYDQYHKRKDSLFRITSKYKQEGSEYLSAQTDGNVATTMLQKFPEVERTTRLLSKDDVFLYHNATAFKEGIIYTDSSFTKVFAIDLLAGSQATCLINPSSIIISRKIAKRLFGNGWKKKSVIGQTLSLDGRIPLNITGVFESFPSHSHFESELFASVPTGHRDWMGDKSKVYTYALLATNANVELLKSKLKMHKELSGSGNTELNLQPITKIHLFSNFGDENGYVGNIKNIYSLVFVSLLLLIMTLANFVNLYTAGSFGRLKEIGVRKAIGAVNRQLRYQFLLETAISTLLAILIAVLVVLFFLRDFSAMTSKRFAPESLLDANILSLLFGFFVVIPIIASFYPSLYLSSYKAMDALKGKVKEKHSIFGWRKGLVVLQFSISTIMITLSVVSYHQVSFLNNKSLGFDKENIITLSNPYMLGSIDKIVAFKNHLLTIPGIINASITGYTPAQNRWGSPKVTFPSRDQHDRLAAPANWLTVDEGFIQTMGIQLISGRNFSHVHENDIQSIIINETAARHFTKNAREKDPLALELSIQNERDSVYATYKVIGVVKDFNFGSLHEVVKPVVMKVGYHRFEMALRLSPERSRQEVLRQISMIWKQNNPEIPFQYDTLKDRYDLLHKSDTTSSRVFLVFCILIVIISGFGLFSIVAYSIFNRTKEVGVRKVLGASELGIVLLLSKEFRNPLIASYVLALPAASIIANKWINDFAYKIEISFWLYGITAFVLFIMTGLTLGFQSVRAAAANPIDNLRSD